VRTAAPITLAIALLAGACSSGSSDEPGDPDGAGDLQELCELVTETAPVDGPPETPEEYEAFFTWGLENARAKAAAAPQEIAADYQASLADYETWVEAVEANDWSPEGIPSVISDQAREDRILDYEIDNCGIEDIRP
jgi:hypothetical protein